MALSAVHSLEISTASTRGRRSIFCLKYFSILPGTGSICESIHSRIYGPSSGRSAKYYGGGNRTPWSILAVSSSIYFGRTLRVLAVFPGSTYSGYSSYCKVFRMFVRQVLLAYSGFCILLIMFPALAVFGLSVLPILPVLAALL